MKTKAVQFLIFVVGLMGVVGCCQAQTAKTNVGIKNSACRHCGKSSCNNQCVSSSTAKKKNEEIKNSSLTSCSLSAQAFTERKEEVAEKIFSKAKAITAIKNGYAIRFNEPKEFSSTLLEFINFERSCCTGFTWALVFEANNKSTYLQVYGATDIRNELHNLIAAFGLTHLLQSKN